MQANNSDGLNEIAAIHSFIQPFLYQILSNQFLSHPEFMLLYSAVYKITSTPARIKLLERVLQDIYAFLLTISDDQVTFNNYITASKLLNKALRHLCIGNRGSPRLQVYQMCLRAWITSGKHPYPEPLPTGEDGYGPLANLTDQLGSITIL